MQLVCRDFAVLEDHCLAHNLQEQEIESHLASNVHKSRLVQQDLQVAKRMQEEEDLRAKAQSKKQYRDIERQDNEIAQEIQEELVRQAEQQRWQEEKDADIARKLQEKEMKEERRRQKQIEANFEEEYYEGQVCQDKPKRLAPPDSSRHNLSRDDVWHEPSRTPNQSRFKPRSPHTRSRYPKHDLLRETDPYPEHRLPSKGKQRHTEYQATETRREKEAVLRDEGERAVRARVRPPRPAPPQFVVERDQDRERDKAGERHGDRPRNIDWESDLAQERRSEREVRREACRAGEPKRDKDRENDQKRNGEKSCDGEESLDEDDYNLKARTRSRERPLLEAHVPSQEEEDYDDGKGKGNVRGTLVVPSSVVGDQWAEHRSRREGRRREEKYAYRDVPREERSLGHPPREPGHVVQGGVGGGAAVLAGGEYGVGEATQGLTRLELRELREQELRDLEVARKMQEEEIKASKIDKRAAQVAQDEEIARLLMEQEKKEYKKSKEKERQALEKRRPEGDYKLSTEEVVRPRSREEYEYQRQKNHNKPDRPPRPRTPEYENVNPGNGYSENPFTPRVPSRPEAAYKGAYYRQ
ncbi:coiled-coil domain-containing protein 50 isoform X2 [Hypomesus transpacificus]|uniref:coiled-coil domain-containing protein 50 isoform X2 n=1 Tax=Hypomesus transpacificus TaxID=137520 RepID=UPI001F086B66|nr:coiled-coil domain-containing protein 50 isoform X2 [Hypomesus transpacificus]